MKKFSIILWISLSLALGLKAAGNEAPEKESQNNYTKNIVFVQGNLWIMGTAANVGFERILYVGERGYYSASVSYGSWKDEYEDGNLFSITGNYLFGKKSHQLELNLGALAKIHYDQYYTDRNKFDHLTYLPDLYVGYRYKKPSGHLLLKAGVGFPSLASVGIGVAF